MQCRLALHGQLDRELARDLGRIAEDHRDRAGVAHADEARSTVGRAMEPGVAAAELRVLDLPVGLLLEAGEQVALAAAALDRLHDDKGRHRLAVADDRARCDPLRRRHVLGHTVDGLLIGGMALPRPAESRRELLGRPGPAVTPLVELRVGAGLGPTVAAVSATPTPTPTASCDDDGENGGSRGEPNGRA